MAGKKALMLIALEKSNGIVSTAAKKANIGRTIHYKWLKDDEAYRQRVKEIDEAALDFVESQHFKNIRAGKEASIIFHLKTKGRVRGYYEKFEVAPPPGQQATFIILPNGREVQI